MADWPSISKLYESIEEASIMPAIRSPKEAGYIQTRPQFTLAKKRFTLRWRSLSDADHSTLRTFFETTVTGGGASFDWGHPSGTTYTVRFMDDELRFINRERDYWKGSVKLREV